MAAPERFAHRQIPLAPRAPSVAPSQSTITPRLARVFGHGARRRGPALGPRSRSTADDAKAALDRIILPQDVLDRIAPTASPRSSLIISDEPLHKETNYRTEFVVALNNQPQGGMLAFADTRVGFWGGWPSSNTPARGGYYQRSQGWW